MENIASFESNHSGTINTVKFNYTGDIIASGGNDGKINIFETNKIFPENNKIIESIKLSKNGHSKPINDLSFSHPCYGNYLSSWGKDQKLIIWKEVSKRQYQNLYTYTHESSINCCKFAPSEYGIIVLCGMENGSVGIHKLVKETQTWQNVILKNVSHEVKINSVDWFPALPPVNLEEDGQGEGENGLINIESDNNNDLMPMRFITCGEDKKIKIFVSKDNTINTFTEEDSIDVGDSIPLSIGVLNFVGYLYLTFAVGLSNGNCLIYKYEDNKWEQKSVIQIKSPIIKIFWSLCGTYLGISYFNRNNDVKNEVRFYRENMDDTWVEVK